MVSQGVSILMALLLALPFAWAEVPVGGAVVTPKGKIRKTELEMLQPPRKLRPDQYECAQDRSSAQEGVVSVAIDSPEYFLQTVARKKNGKILQIDGVISNHAALDKIQRDDEWTLNAWAYLAEISKTFEDYKSANPGMGIKGVSGGDVTGMGFSGNVQPMGVAKQFTTAPPSGWGGTVWGEPGKLPSLGRPGDKAGDDKRPGEKVDPRVGSTAGENPARTNTDLPKPEPVFGRAITPRYTDTSDPTRLAPTTGGAMKPRGTLGTNQSSTAELSGRTPGPRQGDQVGLRPGATLGRGQGIVAFSAVLDGNGNLSQVIYRDGNEPPKSIRITPENSKSADPIFQKLQANLEKLKSYSNCCNDDSKAICDTKYAPPLKVSPAGVKDFKPGDALINPFGPVRAQPAK